jgi:uncharacterized membrane protein YesL
MQNIFLLFVERNRKIPLKNYFEKRIKRELKITMAAVLIGPKEVLVIMIVTAIVVFVVMVRRRRGR